MRDVELPEVVEPGATGPTFSQDANGYLVVHPPAEQAHEVPSQVDTEATDGTDPDEPASSPGSDGI